MKVQLVMVTLDVNIVKSESSPMPVNVTPDIVRVSDCVIVNGMREEVIVQLLRERVEDVLDGERWSDGLD